MQRCKEYGERDFTQNDWSPYQVHKVLGDAGLLEEIYETLLCIFASLRLINS
jgi:hypothetical protein